MGKIAHLPETIQALCILGVEALGGKPADYAKASVLHVNANAI